MNKAEPFQVCGQQNIEEKEKSKEMTFLHHNPKPHNHIHSHLIVHRQKKY